MSGSRHVFSLYTSCTKKRTPLGILRQQAQILHPEWDKEHHPISGNVSINTTDPADDCFFSHAQICL